jgi:hypothetical protein
MSERKLTFDQIVRAMERDKFFHAREVSSGKHPNRNDLC